MSLSKTLLKLIISGLFCTIFVSQAQAVSQQTVNTEFAKADRDNNELLSKREFRRFVSRMSARGNVNANALMESEQVDKYFRISDKNKDGGVSLEEIKLF